MAAAWGVAGLARLSSIFAGFTSPSWVLVLLIMLLLAAFVCVVRLCVPWIPAILLLSLALVPVAPDLGLKPWVVGFVVLVMANAWLHPSQSDYCRVAREAAGAELFDQRQALTAGVVVTLLTLLGLVVAIPYWWTLGLCSRDHVGVASRAPPNTRRPRAVVVPARRAGKCEASRRMTACQLQKMVGRDGIEPPTPGFSVLCSTN
jgi:hypothetical protein